MSDELLEIMKPLIEPIIIKSENERLQQGIQQSLQKFVGIMRGLRHNDNEIEYVIKEQYGLTEEEVKEYI